MPILQPKRQFRVAGYPLPGSGLLANHERVAGAVAGHTFAQHGGQAFHLAGKPLQRRVGGAAARSALETIPRIDCLTLEPLRTR